MPQIKYISFQESTGYGIAARSLIAALRESGMEVIHTGILPGEVQNGGIRVTPQPDTPGAGAVIVHTVPEYFPFWYKREKRNDPEVPVWGYTAWETDTIPGHWTALLNLMDGIFVPCNWNREVFRKCGVTTRIEVLPHIAEFCGSNREPERSRLLLPPDLEGRFLFYSIGVWNERKNIPQLIKAFNQEFSPNEHAALVIKTGREDWTCYDRKWNRLFLKRFGRSSDAFHRLMKKEKIRSRIIHIDRDLPPGDIASLHHAGNCFVSFTRGEGWGMGACEAAWFGRPVIITGFGGALDFLPGEYAYHLKYNLVPVHTEYGKQSYTSGQRWAEVDVKEARKILRHVFENREEARSKGRDLKNYVENHFAPSLIVRKCLKAIYIHE